MTGVQTCALPISAVLRAYGLPVAASAVAHSADEAAALAAVIESGPTPAVHGVVRWRIVDLCQWLFEEFRVTVSKQTLSRELRGMGYRKLSARPRHHAQREGAIEDFKKPSRPLWRKSPTTKASTQRM